MTPRHGVHTATELHRSTRRLDRFRREADRVLAATMAGAFLHLQYQNGRPIWRLSSGPFVTAEAARILISSARVAPANDALFNDLPGLSQTWRYAK